MKAADLKKKPSEELAACVRIAFDKDPELGAQLLGGLKWSDDTAVLFEKFQVEPRVLLAMSTYLENKPRVAMSVLQLATAEREPPRANEIDLSIIRVGRQLEKTEPAKREDWIKLADAAADRMLSRDALGSLQRARLLGFLVERGDKPRRLYLCNERADSTIIWTCLAQPDADIDRSIPALANLPALTWDDFSAIEKATKGHLPGLRCKTESARTVTDVFEQVDKGTARRDEARLYYRLRVGATNKVADCLTQEAALACMREIDGMGRCTVLSSFAEYMRTRSMDEQLSMIDHLIEKKNHEYHLLSRDIGSASMVFHIHLVLAEALFKLANPKKGPTWIPQYHVGRAFSFFHPAQGQNVRFDLILPRSVRQQVCADKDCRLICRGERECMNSCGLPADAAKAACPSPSPP